MATYYTMYGDYFEVDYVLRRIMNKSVTKRDNVRVEVKNSVGLFCGKEVIANRDWPERDITHMDGYAVKLGKERYFTIVGEVKLGIVPKFRVEENEAVYVPTGTYLPEGSDAVLRVEDCIIEGKRILPKSEVRRGQYIFRKGSDLEKGRTIIKEGERIRLQHIPPLLTLGYEKIEVRKPLKVSIVATGSELSERREPGKIRNTHSAMISSFVRQNGCSPIYLGIVPDKIETIRSTLREASKTSDIVIATGGTSMGKKDITVSALRSLEPELVFHGIKMDRGRVTCVAVLNGKPIIVVPGPIQATMNALILFCFPLIHHMLAARDETIYMKAYLAEDWKAREGFEDFRKVLYVKLKRENNELVAYPVVGPTESMSVLLSSDGVVIVPESISSIRQGEHIDVMLVPGFTFSFPLEIQPF
jgi:molybdenum cofactor synthesis domain-containing protein